LYRKRDLSLFFFTGFFDTELFFADGGVFFPAAFPEVVEIFFVDATAFLIAATGFLVFAPLFFTVVAAFTIRNSHLLKAFIIFLKSHL
jgi:hypothetical protein